MVSFTYYFLFAPSPHHRYIVSEIMEPTTRAPKESNGAVITYYKDGKIAEAISCVDPTELVRQRERTARERTKLEAQKERTKRNKDTCDSAAKQSELAVKTLRWNLSCGSWSIIQSTVTCHHGWRRCPVLSNSALIQMTMTKRHLQLLRKQHNLKDNNDVRRVQYQRRNKLMGRRESLH